MPVEFDHSQFNILQEIESFHKDSQIEREALIILSWLHSDGDLKKLVVTREGLPSLRLNFPHELVDYISSIIDSGRTTGYVKLKNELNTEVTYVVEVVRHLNSILILGAGHVGRSLSIVASILGFEVTLLDDREEFLSDNDISGFSIKKVLSSFSSYSESVFITSSSAIVIVTRGHQYDEICLKNAISTKAKYIGMIGSKRRVLAILNNLRKENLTEQQTTKLEKIYAPIGLDIGAVSPQEIAISILAQIVKVMNCH